MYVGYLRKGNSLAALPNSLATFWWCKLQSFFCLQKSGYCSPVTLWYSPVGTFLDKNLAQCQFSVLTQLHHCSSCLKSLTKFFFCLQKSGYCSPVTLWYSPVGTFLDKNLAQCQFSVLTQLHHCSSCLKSLTKFLKFYRFQFMLISSTSNHCHLCQSCLFSESLCGLTRF